MSKLLVPDWRSADSRDTASALAAALLVDCLRADLRAQQDATLVVSGGTTPTVCFNHLADTPLDWSRVHVTLTDERWVDESDPASNAAMIRRELLRGHASQANLVPFFEPGETRPESAVADRLALLPNPPSAALLGMGTDGHFASLFPDAEHLAMGLDPDSGISTLEVSTAASPVPRVSLTLQKLLQSRLIVLLVFGHEKRAVINAALDGDSQYPIYSLFAERLSRLTVVWAP